MKVVDAVRLMLLLEAAARPGARVVTAGNQATPWCLLDLVDKALAAIVRVSRRSAP